MKEIESGPLKGVSVEGHDPKLEDITGTGENMLKMFEEMQAKRSPKDQERTRNNIKSVHIINS